MKLFLSFLILLTLFGISDSCFSQTEKQNVLIITGGKKIDTISFLNIFDDISEITYLAVTHPNVNKLYGSPIMDEFDLLIFYDVVQDISESQKEDFINLLNKGKNVLFLHHSLVNYQEWGEYENIIGGRYYQSTNNIDKAKFVQSTYRHDVQIPVTIADKKHPITKGMKDFIIHDEVYDKYKVLSEVHPILTTTHSESETIIGWTHSYRNSKIVYIQLGHDHHAYEDPNYRQLIKQSIDWLTIH